MSTGSEHKSLVWYCFNKLFGVCKLCYNIGDDKWFIFPIYITYHLLRFFLITLQNGFIGNDEWSAGLCGLPIIFSRSFLLALENAFNGFVLELLCVTFYQSFSLWNLFRQFNGQSKSVSDSESDVFLFNNATRQNLGTICCEDRILVRVREFMIRNYFSSSTRILY